jgi:hypothetical protein
VTLLAFLGALSLSVLAFELLSTFQNAFSMFGNNRLMRASTSPATKRRSTWEALLVAILPGRFDPAAGEEHDRCDQPVCVAPVTHTIRPANSTPWPCATSRCIWRWAVCWRAHWRR